MAHCDVANDFGVDDNVLEKSADGDVVAATISIVVYVCGVSEYCNCDTELVR